MSLRKTIFIPRTMATQHPDNANIPYWRQNAFVSTADEVEECYRSYADFGCQEYMWDWEGKFVDEAVVDRLYQKYFDYFRKHPLGEKTFLTFRIPNISKEGKSRLARAFAGILSASYFAKEIKMHVPPLFEVIHPMTTSVEQLITLQKKYHETARFQAKILGVKQLKPRYLRVIPLIEGTGSLLRSKKILAHYAHFYQKFTGHLPHLLRPFIARSDPALDGGFIPAVLSAKAALSQYFSFEKETGIRIYPVIGAGSLRFRGGLSPETLTEFFNLYPGIATVTLQSAFRYDHSYTKVKAAIEQINERLPCHERPIYSAKEFSDIIALDRIFVKYFRESVVSLADFINEMAKHIPQRRERLQHIGHFGYSRTIGKKGVQLPRAITFTAIFYSLGLPPELIGMGRGLNDAKKLGLLSSLEKLFPNLSETIRNIGEYFNAENLSILAKRSPAWRVIETEIRWIEDYVGVKLGPTGGNSLLHRNYTSNVIQRLLKGEPLEEDILKAACIRRSLG